MFWERYVPEFYSWSMFTDDRLQVGAGIQIPPNSSRILRRWGILDQIEAVSLRPQDLTIRSYHDGRILSTLHILPEVEERYRAPYLHIHRADYHKVLAAEAERLGVSIQLCSTVTGVNFEKPSLIFKNGSEFCADIILGADGLKSVTREALVGHPDPPHFTGNLAYRIVIKASEMRKYPELRDLADRPALTFWVGPDAHAVGYLLQGGNLYNIVLACPDNLPELVNTAKADVAEMRAIFQGWDHKLKKLLSLVQETSKWRLMNSKEMSRWSHPSGKFTLLGDACHATLPYL